MDIARAADDALPGFDAVKFDGETRRVELVGTTER